MISAWRGAVRCGAPPASPRVAFLAQPMLAYVAQFCTCLLLLLLSVVTGRSLCPGRLLCQSLLFSASLWHPHSVHRCDTRPFSDPIPIQSPSPLQNGCPLCKLSLRTTFQDGAHWAAPPRTCSVEQGAEDTQDRRRSRRCGQGEGAMPPPAASPAGPCPHSKKAWTLLYLLLWGKCLWQCTAKTKGRGASPQLPLGQQALHAFETSRFG